MVDMNSTTPISLKDDSGDIYLLGSLELSPEAIKKIKEIYDQKRILYVSIGGVDKPYITGICLNTDPDDWMISKPLPKVHSSIRRIPELEPAFCKTCGEQVFSYEPHKCRGLFHDKRN